MPYSDTIAITSLEPRISVIVELDVLTDHHATGVGITVDIKCDVRKGREILGPDVLFMGNVDTYTMTCDPKTPVEKTVDHIKDMIDGGMDAVMPGCDLWPDIIDANMQACVDTTHEYGKKASPAVGRL